MRVAVLTSLASLAGFAAGCGGSSSEDEQTDPVSGGAAVRVVVDALDAELSLEETGGVDDTFTPTGEDCRSTLRSSDPVCCVIEMIYIGEDIGFFLGPAVVVAPDESYAVEVGKFSSTELRACLDTVEGAIQAVGPIELQ